MVGPRDFSRHSSLFTGLLTFQLSGSLAPVAHKFPKLASVVLTNRGNDGILPIRRALLDPWLWMVLSSNSQSSDTLKSCTTNTPLRSQMKDLILDLKSFSLYVTLLLLSDYNLKNLCMGFWNGPKRITIPTSNAGNQGTCSGPFPDAHDLRPT